jgi:hypothetical protein
MVARQGRPHGVSVSALGARRGDPALIAYETPIRARREVERRRTNIKGGKPVETGEGGWLPNCIAYREV